MLKKTRLVVLAGGLWAALLLMAGGDARAQKKETQAASNHQLVQAIHVLQSTNTVLQGANHDYGGHRANAIVAITTAQNSLNLALQFAKNNPAAKDKGKGKGKGKAKDKATTKDGKGKGKGKPEAQGISDTQLKDAIPILKKTVHHLKNAKHDYGGNRAVAIQDLEQAISQLQAALKFRKGKGKGK